jgi:hypothetical protein
MTLKDLNPARVTPARDPARLRVEGRGEGNGRGVLSFHIPGRQDAMTVSLPAFARRHNCGLQDQGENQGARIFTRRGRGSKTISRNNSGTAPLIAFDRPFVRGTVYFSGRGS